jgi:hypothetical protein
VIKDVYASIQKLFGGYQDAWARGLIKLYEASNGIGGEHWSWTSFIKGETVKLDRSSLSIKDGYFNNAMTFSIEGWAPRYGLSLEFLLSLHLGTMAPDLNYAIIQNFDTEIQVYLEESKGKVNAKYVDP